MKTSIGGCIRGGCYGVLLLLLATTAKAELSDGNEPDSNIIIQVRSENWHGYSEAGDGYLFQLLRAAFEPLGYQLKFKFCPWMRCVQDVVESRADIITSVYGDEPFIGSYITINRHPVYIERIAVAFKAQSVHQWQGQQSLAGKTLGMIRGYDLQQQLDVAVKLTEVSTNQQLWRLLLADRIDFIIDGITPLREDNTRFSQYSNQFRIEPIYQNISHFGFSVSVEGQRLQQLFDQQLLKLYQSGKVQALQKQHGIDWLTSLELKE
ncbi:transporter substrate-binding domain-containing protein [Dasania marina]|uniref:substrate-binding periplasmic protein n=1 Tax=Dasania marina TaxID=471499 RepID=UPI0030DA50AA